LTFTDNHPSVVLVDFHDNQIGVAEKLEAHRNGGRLHRAFRYFFSTTSASCSCRDARQKNTTVRECGQIPAAVTRVRVGILFPRRNYAYRLKSEWRRRSNMSELFPTGFSWTTALRNGNSTICSLADILEQCLPIEKKWMPCNGFLRETSIDYCENIINPLRLGFP